MGSLSVQLQCVRCNFPIAFLSTHQVRAADDLLPLVSNQFAPFCHVRKIFVIDFYPVVPCHWLKPHHHLVGSLQQAHPYIASLRGWPAVQTDWQDTFGNPSLEMSPSIPMMY